MVEPATLVVKAAPQSVKQAREFVTLVFGAWGLEDYPARMVISELVTNAVRHGSSEGDQVIVRAYRREDGVPVVEAWDRSDSLPVVREVGLDSESGRGLQHMEVLVRSWGTRALDEGGKVVWAAIEPLPA